MDNENHLSCVAFEKTDRTLGMIRSAFDQLNAALQNRFHHALTDVANKGKSPEVILGQVRSQWNMDVIAVVLRAHADPTARAISQDEFIAGAGE